MNFKTILTVLSFNILALSNPIYKEYSTEVVDNFTNGEDNLQFLKKNNNLMDKTQNANTNNENVCNTAECIEVADKLIKSMDTTVDPCEDFYQFTCGNYIKTHPASPNNPRVSNMLSSGNHKDELLKIIEGNYQPNKNLSQQDREYDENVFNKLKNFYKSCMDVNDIKSKGGKPVLDLINRLKIHEMKNKFNDPNVLTEMLIALHLNSISPDSDSEPALFTFTVELDEQMRANLLIDKAEQFSKEYNKGILEKILLKVYDDSENKDINKMIESFISFENLLFEGTDESIKKDKSIKNWVSVKTLNEKYPFINWKVYLEERFKSSGLDSTEINDEFTINVRDEKYLETLKLILGKVNGETLANYFEISTIVNYITFLPILPSLYEDRDTRSELCFGYLNDEYMSLAMGKYYVEQYFTPNKKQYSEKLIEYIKTTMINRIQQMEWLDPPTIEYAIKKVTNMTEIIGYPEVIFHPKSIYELYKDLEFTENDFFNNIVSVSNYFNNVLLKYAKYSKEDFQIIQSAPQIPNAFYMRHLNKIIILAAILQPPMFSAGIPDYINYGGIGSVIGHELTHAFDNDGKKFDMNGNYYNWWTDDDQMQYEDLTKCFIDQYNQFEIKDLDGDSHHIDGKGTLDENLSDNGGLARAYESWKLSLLEDPETVKKENKQLPGLTNFTNDQLFFISFGNMWCESFYNSKSYLENALKDEHAKGFARVNGVVSNSKEFAKAFNCPLKSKMNPQNKCVLW